jgi:asparagine synthase (glutamine-hydrolysing)
MCGLTGFWQSAGDNEATLCQQITRMMETLAHRGPDDSGAWVDPDVGLALGFRRLAILDLSPLGHQPMLSPDGRFVIVFNGEIYNYRDLRAELEQQGLAFRGTSDTEVILAGAVRWGAESVIPRLWGMFALALWDRQERSLLLARDRLGKKPLYYSALNGTYLFGSELKALRAHPAFRADVDRDALSAYLRFGYVPAPYSIYTGVRKLPPGAYALFRPHQAPVLHRYWDARQIAEQGLSQRLTLTDAEAVETLDGLLRDATARRMIADVPLGALLSGGVDSSAVVALMQAQSARPVKTFTIGFHVPNYNEAAMARAVAQHLGTEHTELYVTPDKARAVIPRLPALYDEPFADSSQIPTFLVCQLARQSVTVSLSGDGGDELFAGYTRYAWAESIWKWAASLPTFARSGLRNVIYGLPTHTWDSLYAGVEPVLPRRLRQTLPGDKLYKFAALLGSNHPDALYHRLVSLWKTPDELVIGGREPDSILMDVTTRQSFPNFAERMMFWDLVTYLSDDILVKVDRASMGVSLEARAPLLDHRVVEWVWRLPLRLKQRNGQSKWLLRQVLYRYMPRALIERPKMGFGVPIDAWLRSPLREWAEALLDEGRLRREGFFNPAPIRAVWRAHLNGSQNEPYRLWAILMFQAWSEQWRTA